jgi:DNA-binding helix-hairpin-helix protein with protein kinase domain
MLHEENLRAWNLIDAAARTEVKKRRKARSVAENLLNTAESRWAEIAGRYTVEWDNKYSELDLFRQRHEGLAGEYVKERQELQGRAREMQLTQHLQQHFISDHDIPGIGPARKATLASFGIETAFDVNKMKVLSVPGFKEKRTEQLLAWRQKIERSFSFNPAIGVPPVERQRLESKYAQARQPAEVQLLAGESALRAISKRAESELQSVDDDIRKCLEQLAQADLDLSVLPTRT